MVAAHRLRVVLYEGHGATPLDKTQRYEITRALLEKGYGVTRCLPGGQVSDAAESGTLLVLGRFAGAPPEVDESQHVETRALFREVGNLNALQVLELAASVRAEFELPVVKPWKPWFPVIDFGRCTNCMQCLSFCLFDVYAVSPAGKITVQNHQNCKTDCPACSRVCPEVAILFPKYKAGPINGDEINSDDLRREAMKVDISSLLGGDIYAALRDRSAKAKSRFSKERDEDRALKERQRCLAKLQQQMDIPAEVMASLPSLDQIQAKAVEAKNRAAAALQKNSAADHALADSGSSPN